MKREGIHLSKWITCVMCKQEFWGKSASICKECRRDIYKQGYRTYEEWVEEGNCPVEI
jgi:hypothetical protein